MLHERSARSDEAGARMAGWSDLAVRAATSVVASAVLYKARGAHARLRHHDRRLLIAGENGGVGRYVRSDANRARGAPHRRLEQDARAAGAAAAAARRA